jgi:hypothetical protein
MDKGKLEITLSCYEIWLIKLCGMKKFSELRILNVLHKTCILSKRVAQAIQSKKHKANSKTIWNWFLKMYFHRNENVMGSFTPLDLVSLDIKRPLRFTRRQQKNAQATWPTVQRGLNNKKGQIGTLENIIMVFTYVKSLRVLCCSKDKKYLVQVSFHNYNGC